MVVQCSTCTCLSVQKSVRTVELSPAHRASRTKSATPTGPYLLLGTSQGNQSAKVSNHLTSKWRLLVSNLLRTKVAPDDVPCHVVLRSWSFSCSFVALSFPHLVRRSQVYWLHLGSARVSPTLHGKKWTCWDFGLTEELTIYHCQHVCCQCLQMWKNVSRCLSVSSTHLPFCLASGTEKLHRVCVAQQLGLQLRFTVHPCSSQY